MPRLRFAPSGPPRDYLTLAQTADSEPTTIYIDQSTRVAAADRNGSVLAPFATITEAIAFINEQPGVAWHLECAFGDYSAEPTIELLPNRRYVFDGVFRSSVLMRLPTFLWTVAGPDTSYVQFRNVEAGLVTIVDGSPISTVTVIVYENAACRGINAATSLATISMIISGISLASYQTSESTFAFAVARSAPILLNNGIIYAQNCQFDSTCTLIRAVSILANGCSFGQDIQITGTEVEIRDSRWTHLGHPFTFTGAAGTAFLDPTTQHSFDIGSAVLVNGTIVATDQTYDTSFVIPIPEGSTTGQTTFGSLVTFVGASYRIPNYVSATHLFVQATAVSAPTTIVVGIYQAPTGQTTGTIPRVAFGSLLVAAPGTFLIPLASLVRLVPGALFILYGKVAAGGNVTFRTYTTPTQDLLNDPTTVPAAAYPTGFTTTLGVTTTPPSSLNPTPSGGVVTAAGASNVTAIVRLATP